MRELKAGLSRHVAQARAGTVIEITSHDKSVSRLIGVPAVPAGGVAGMVAAGAASWRGGKPAFAPPVRMPPHPMSMSETVIEDRA